MNMQKRAIQNAELFFKNNSLNKPNLTGKIWNIISGSNDQRIITKDDSFDFEENWSCDLIGKLQRYLVNYQLHQMRRNNPPQVFVKIKETFNKIEKGLTVLDIGCTTGYYFEVLNHYFPNQFSYEGCDYNKHSIDLAKHYYPDVNFFFGDLTNLENIKDNAYDITFLSGVIEHIPKYEQAIKELCRITKKYIILHRIWLTEKETKCRKGMQYYVPVIRNEYNKKSFFNYFDKRFKIFWTSGVYDGNCKTYILKSD